MQANMISIQICIANIVHFVFIRCLKDIFKNQVTNSRILFVQILNFKL